MNELKKSLWRVRIVVLRQAWYALKCGNVRAAINYMISIIRSL